MKQSTETEDIPTKAFSPFEWEEYYLPCRISPRLHPTVIDDTAGKVRSGIWPFYSEEYYGDDTPLTSFIDGFSLRLIKWIRFSPDTVPSNWRKVPFGEQVHICYHLLESDYYLKWSRSARAYRSHWYKNRPNNRYTIEVISLEEFTEAYALSTVAQEIPHLEVDKLNIRLKHFSDRISILGARRLSDGRVVAGLYSFDSPANKGSHYGCGFYLPEVSKDHLMVILMDTWFTESLKKNLRVLHLGTIMDPAIVKEKFAYKRMYAISRFKRQFATHYHLYQTPLFQIKFSNPIWKKI
jgi:hypothetical protein